jgi:hypothetical protein
MRFWIAVVAVMLLAACGGSENVNTTPDVSDTGNKEENAVDAGEVACAWGADSCTKEFEAVVTFWDLTSWGGAIYCDGDRVTPEGREEGHFESIEDIGPDSCDTPGVFTFTYQFEYKGGDCEYCSHAEGKTVCVPLSNQCGMETVEITASGSEETGIHPMMGCQDVRGESD